MGSFNITSVNGGVSVREMGELRRTLFGKGLGAFYRQEARQR